MLRPMIGEPIISVIMVTIAPVDRLPGADEVDVRRVPAKPFPPIFASHDHRTSSGWRCRPSMWSAWPYLAGHHGRLRPGSSNTRGYGLAMRATAWDQQVAQSLGISVKPHVRHERGRSPPWSRRWRASSWRVVNGVSSGARPSYGIKVFPAVILGGLDSIVGAVHRRH